LLLLAVQSPGLWNPVLFSFYPTAAAASIAINAATLRSGFAQSGAASVSDGLASLAGFSLPKTPAGWTYGVFILLYVATGECGQHLIALHLSFNNTRCM
jgi:hypothetical protein